MNNIKTSIVKNIKEITSFYDKVGRLAQKANSDLNFHTLHTSLNWFKHFNSKDGSDFGSKRGRNFYGMKSFLDDFFLIISESNNELVGMVPLAKWRIFIKGQKDPVNLISFCADSVLVFFQDLLVLPALRKEIIEGIGNQLISIAEEEKALLFLGYIPENSSNLKALKIIVSEYTKDKWDGGFVTSRIRGGVYPWTTEEILKALNYVKNNIMDHKKEIIKINSLTRKLENQTSSLLAFPQTRKEIESDILSIEEHLSKINNQFAEVLTSAYSVKPIVYPYLILPKNKQQFLSSLSKSKRYYFNRYLRKFTESGGEFEGLQGDSVTEFDVEEYLKLHLQRWHRDSVAVNDQTMAFHKEFTLKMANAGYLKIFFANLNNQRIAAHICIDFGERREYYFSGRDKSVTNLPVGKLLVFHTILDAMENDIKIYDFGYGGDEYKADFTKDSRTVECLLLAKRGEMPDLNAVFPKYEYLNFD